MNNNNDLKIPRCAECKIEKRICREEGGTGPAYCPTINLNTICQESLAEYERAGIRKFAINATIQEGECYVNKEPGNPHTRYAIKPRMQEVIEFAHKMGYQRLGLAFCVGLRGEAEIITGILKAQGFEVASVACKAGRAPKELLGIKEEQKVTPGRFESMCNPIIQAKLLNALPTDLNILVGLCVGHDSLFLRYSEALCTVLAVKDRVTGHNPLAAVYLHKSYYQKLKEERFNKGGTTFVNLEENV